MPILNQQKTENQNNCSGTCEVCDCRTIKELMSKFEIKNDEV